MKKKSILVIGSSNTDMVIRVPELPLPGQTVLGDEFRIFCGGKGANKAIAARRAGGNVRFLAAVGDDEFGKAAIDNLKAAGIDTQNIQIIDDIASGVAMIFVDDHGENCISIAAGANARLSAEILIEQQYLFDDADPLLIQLETPMESIVKAINLASERDVRVVLNPAPAAVLTDDLLQQLFCITPNEIEAETLTGIAVVDAQSAATAAAELLRRGVQNVIITMGESGALLCNAEGVHHETAKRVPVADTTGAGDTFNGVLAAMLAEGRSLRAAVKLAVEAATQSVQSAGANA